MLTSDTFNSYIDIGIQRNMAVHFRNPHLNDAVVKVKIQGGRSR